MEMTMWWITVLFGFLLLVAPVAHADEAYPARPVRIVVAFPAGGSVDIVARLAAQELAKRLGQSFVVENRSGGGGVVGTDAVTKSAPDGYTLLMAGATPIVSAPALNSSMPFDPSKDLSTITLIALQANMLIVHPSLPVRTVQDFIAHARAHPGALSYGSAGIGSAQHLSGEAFALRTGVQMVHVPYRGGAPALSDLIGGQIQVMFETIPTALQAVRANQARAVAVTTINRSPAMPELPTIAESGLPGYEMRAWLGMLGPRGMPQPVIALLDRHLREIAETPEIKAKLVDLGLEVVPSTPASFRTFLDDELAANRALVQAAKITLD
jgi:tripartite-type tricarboxylate transporter receptor subunit TctC